jgi:hypothetical protein
MATVREWSVRKFGVTSLATVLGLDLQLLRDDFAA